MAGKHLPSANAGYNPALPHLRAARARSSHKLTATVVPMAPATVRMKLMTPAADAVSSGFTAPKAMVVSGMKKKGMPNPWSNCGVASVQKSAPLDHCVRSSAVAPSHEMPTQTRSRGSTLVDSRATTGDMITAATPVIAVT